MSGKNTRGVGEVLKKHGLESILEAHCYLEHNGERFDFTRPATSETMNLHVLLEEEISPTQIGSYKSKRHREAMNDWLRERGLALTLDEAWKIREECISVLLG